MKVQVTKNLRYQDQDVKVGDVLELPDEVAHDLIDEGHAREVVDEPKSSSGAFSGSGRPLGPGSSTGGRF